MNIIRIILDLLSIGAIISAILTITSKNPVNSVIGLISVFVHSSTYLIILSLNFIGLSYLIIYVGAISILFLFVVMMMNIKYIELTEVAQEYTQNLPLSLIIGSLFILESFSSILIPFNNFIAYVEIWNNSLKETNTSFNIIDNKNLSMVDSYKIEDFIHIESLGHTLYTFGLLWFILGSCILLLAMVGPIALCHTPKYNLK
ncbi:NADH:ubiquinone/plastoquinone oxidoreductase [Piptocephalis cylindrospora]|uniref:NADH:ubiquinone/plastoquinone oxidoreductase n=1 Tax=Piptocephalis cylindrospora TaxID=1907219 RepID=A0A4P9Y0W3_9FUNG|nr:NADH:ubiquinone/plastoquinone oxidoreductase [Piptocephalis cylindrospora]|eukprot:RKP12383.1 NADH:ubiquinone/plastoquinone oxidoreductase [Piptocephalis cylindrospora]